MTTNPFWQYSLALYQRPGVANFCLNLQDGLHPTADRSAINPQAQSADPENEHANVNVLLFCCWVGRQGVELTQSDMPNLEASIATWHQDQVLPLRAARRALGSNDRNEGNKKNIEEQNKRELLARELEAEGKEQGLLFNWFQASHRARQSNNSQSNNEAGATLGNHPVADAIRHNLATYLLTRQLSPQQPTPLAEMLFEGNPLQGEAEQCPA
ncbi:MAG: DUF2390 domain-containing protein [Porticoccaceae bacterium]